MSVEQQKMWTKSEIVNLVIEYTKGEVEAISECLDCGRGFDMKSEDSHCHGCVDGNYFIERDEMTREEKMNFIARQFDILDITPIEYCNHFNLDFSSEYLKNDIESKALYIKTLEDQINIIMPQIRVQTNTIRSLIGLPISPGTPE